MKQNLRVHDSGFWAALGCILVCVLTCGMAKIHPLIQIGACLAIGFAGFLYFFLSFNKKPKGGR
jgi:hypothetical protein